LGVLVVVDLVSLTGLAAGADSLLADPLSVLPLPSVFAVEELLSVP